MHYRDVVAGIVEPLFRVYPTYGENQASLGKRLAAYVDALANLPDDLLKWAVADLMRVSKFMPTAEEIYRKACELAPRETDEVKGAKLFRVLAILKRRAVRGDFDRLRWDLLAIRFEELGYIEAAANVRRNRDAYAEFERAYA